MFEIIAFILFILSGIYCVIFAGLGMGMVTCNDLPVHDAMGNVNVKKTIITCIVLGPLFWLCCILLIPIGAIIKYVAKG